MGTEWDGPQQWSGASGRAGERCMTRYFTDLFLRSSAAPRSPSASARRRSGRRAPRGRSSGSGTSPPAEAPPPPPPPPRPSAARRRVPASLPRPPSRRRVPRRPLPRLKRRHPSKSPPLLLLLRGAVDLHRTRRADAVLLLPSFLPDAERCPNLRTSFSEFLHRPRPPMSTTTSTSVWFSTTGWSPSGGGGSESGGVY